MNFDNEKLRNYDPAVGEELLKDHTRLWICVLLSQARGPVAPADLLDMLPDEVREDPAYAMATIRHLYRSLETLEIGHGTLKEFLLKGHSAYLQEGNELLLQFCRENPDCMYSVANTLYHDSLSAYPMNAVLDCTQKWADRLAHHHVNPQWILEDVRRIADIAVGLGLTTESVRLVLLLRRLNFRYSKTFTEFTGEMCTALIAHGNCGDALQYLIDEDGLRVSTDHAFHYLGRLYAREAWQEARKLRKAIDREYRSGLDDSLRSTLYYAAMEARTPWTEAGRIWDPCDEAGPISGTRGPHGSWGTEQTVQMIWDHCVAWNNPLLLTYKELFANVSDLQELLGCTADSSGIWAYVHSAHEFGLTFSDSDMQRFPMRSLRSAMASNMEALLRMHGVPEDPEKLGMVIRILLGHSSDSELLRGLMVEFLRHDVPGTLRAENGVDLNRESYDQMCLHAQCRGFLHDGQEQEVTPKHWYQKTWENDLERLIEEIHFFEGLACYHKATGNGRELALYGHLDRILDTCRFTFNSRSHWERSYQLPEEIFPLLCTKIITLIFEYNRGRLPSFLENLHAGAAHQLGLYSEGFRKAMGQAVRTLIHLPMEKEAVLPLLASWKTHVLSGIHNRWERTEELLLIYGCYGWLNDEEKAASVWQRMLESSMGPVWHGESEFGLMTSALRHLKTAPGETLQKFASLLDFASGDMTFPNAVKRYKEEFIGALTANGETARAFAYYQFEVLPPPEVVLSNAEGSGFDAPRKGAGYRLGAAHLNEAHAVLEILNNLTCDPYLKWGLCSVFIYSEQMHHHGSAYGKHLSQTLNEIELLNDSQIDAVCEIIAGILHSERLDPDSQQRLINQLSQHLSVANQQRLKCFVPTVVPNRALYVGECSQQSDTGYSYHSDSLLGGEDPAAGYSENGFADYLVGAQPGLHTALKKQLEGNPETLPAAELFTVISRHFHHLIQPDGDVFKKYAWLSTEPNPLPVGRLVAQMIIWHLNHPDNSLSTRAEETLIHLVAFVPEVIEDILQQCIDDRPEYASELCSTVLYEASKKSAAIIGRYLHSRPSLISKISGIQHLSIRMNLLEAGVLLEQVGYPGLHTALKESLPESVAQNTQPFIPDSSFTSIQEVLDDLNSGHFLDHQFSVNISRLMNDYCFPVTRNRVQLSDWYVRRSFYRDQWMMGTYDYFVKHALNNAVAHRVTQENIKVVYEIVNE